MSVFDMYCGCGCGETLPPRNPTGRPRRYVDDAHKSRAKRRRAANPEWSPTIVPMERNLRALELWTSGGPPAQPVEQLAAALEEIFAVQHVLASLAATGLLHPRLTPRTAQLAADLEAALRRTFPSVFPDSVEVS